MAVRLRMLARSERMMFSSSRAVVGNKSRIRHEVAEELVSVVKKHAASKVCELPSHRDKC